MKISEFPIESKVQRKQNIKYCYKNWTRLNITGIFAKGKTKGIFSFKKIPNFCSHYERPRGFIESRRRQTQRYDLKTWKIFFQFLKICSARYGGLEKARNKMLLKKIKSGGNKQFFDSGDYSMAKGHKSTFGKSISPKSKHCMFY